MDWTLILGVTAGVTACAGAWGWIRAWSYFRWYRDRRDQLVLSRRANVALAARLATYRSLATHALFDAVVPSVDPVDAVDATPDDQGGATPYPGQGA